MKKTNVLFLSFFLIGFCGTGLFATEKSLAEKGKECIQGKCNLSNNRDDIVALTHFLYATGKKLNKNMDFASGTIIFEDEGGKIFKSLRDYVWEKYGSKNCKEVSISLKSAYPRKSTHFNDYYRYRKLSKTNCDYAHYGIDIPAGQLPMKDKKHILFGYLGQNGGKTWSFIKMEEAGLKGLDALSHGVDLIKKTSQRLLPSLFQNLKIKLGLTKIEEKNFQKEFEDLLDSADSDISASELLKNRRERIPLEYLAYFMAILLEAKNTQKISDANYLAIKDNVKAFGIQAMTDKRIWQNAINDADLVAKLNNVVASLDKLYDTVKTRFGNEIILYKDVRFY